jgi:hypothetical protein
VILARRQRQENLKFEAWDKYEFKAILGYQITSPVRTTNALIGGIIQ